MSVNKSLILTLSQHDVLLVLLLERDHFVHYPLVLWHGLKQSPQAQLPLTEYCGHAVHAEGPCFDMSAESASDDRIHWVLLIGRPYNVKLCL